MPRDSRSAGSQLNLRLPCGPRGTAPAATGVSAEEAFGLLGELVSRQAGSPDLLENTMSDIDLGPLRPLVQMIAIPLVVLRLMIYEIGNFFVFDVLQLGSFLPITF